MRVVVEFNEEELKELVNRRMQELGYAALETSIYTTPSQFGLNGPEKWRTKAVIVVQTTEAEGIYQ